MMWHWILLSWFVPFLKAQEIMLYAQVGGTVTLPRQKMPGENVYVNWYRESETEKSLRRNPQSGIHKAPDMKTHASLTEDFSLKISPVQETDFGLWRCDQHIFSDTKTDNYRLYRVTIPEVAPVMVGAVLNLECNIESSSIVAKTKTTWIPPVNSGCNLLSQYSKRVPIKDVSRCHSGVWTCRLTYNGIVTDATTTVSVIDFSLADSVYTSVSLSTVNIPCSLSSQIPWSDLNQTGLRGGSWSFTSLNDQQPPKSLLSLSVGPVVRWDPTPEGKGAKIPGRELNNQDLSIHNLPVSENIRGFYNCCLKFNSKTISSKVKVEVLKVISSPGGPIYEGQSLNLTCTLGHAMSTDLTVKWKNPSSSPFPSFPLHPAVLFLTDVKMENKGRWTCELWKGDKMLTSAVISLKIEKAPVDVWLCVAIISGVVLFIMLIVIVIIGIRRHKQMMYRRRKPTRFCCCKNQQPKGFYKT